MSIFNIVNMADDLKIEIFSYYSYLSLLFRENVTDILLRIYGDECVKDTSYVEACDATFVKAICCRNFLFSKIFLEELDYKQTLSWKCLSDAYDHLTSICDRDDLFGNLSVFERMLATKSFVQYVCLSVFRFSPNNIANYGHIIWAMYFDKFTGIFYKEGGWKELKRVAKRYNLLSECFLFLVPNSSRNSFPRLSKQASVNYNTFKNAVKYGDSEYKSENHICKNWIKFNIEHLEEYVTIPLSYEDSIDCFQAEELLQDLNLICDSISEYEINRAEILEKKHQFRTTGILDSETFDRYEKIDSNGEIRIKSPPISDNQCCIKNSNRKRDFEINPGEGLLTSFEKMSNRITAGIESFGDNKAVPGGMPLSSIKCEANLDEFSHETYNHLNDSKQMQTCQTHELKISDFDLLYNTKSFDGDNENDLLGTSVVKHQDEVIIETHVLSRNWKDDLKCYSKIPEKSSCNLMDFFSEKESHIGGESSLSGLDSSFNARNEGCNVNTFITDTLSTKQLVASECDRNSVSSKYVVQVNNGKTNYDGRVSSKKELNTLKEEKNDPEIRKFLRMILVLDDRQGIQYLREPLDNNEESVENAKVRTNKRKKKKSKRKA